MSFRSLYDREYWTDHRFEIYACEKIAKSF